MAVALRWREMRGETTPLRGVIESFLADRHDLSARTRSNYGWILGWFAEWCEGEAGRPAQVGDVEPGTVNAYISSRVRGGSPHSADAAWKALRSLARFLAERRIFHENGESTLRLIKRPKVKDEERRALTDDEMRRVFDACAEGEARCRDRALVWTLMGTGLRASEICNLTLGDVDLDGRQLHVRASTSKSVRPRDVTLASEVIKELDLYVHDRRIAPDDPDAPLFVSRRGGPMTADSLRKFMERLKQRTGIPDLCAHMLRHTWATNFHRSGSGTRNDLMEEGGWKTARMVDRYVKRRPLEERRRAPSPFSAWRRAMAGKQTSGRHLTAV